MRSQKCAECGTLLDVSRLDRGSKFSCSNCGKVLVVGEAVAVKRSLKHSGPAFRPKSAGGAEAPRRGRRQASPGGDARHGASDGSGPKSSSMPMLIGAGALIVVAVVVGIVVSTGGGDEGGFGGGGSRGGGSGGKATAATWWADSAGELSTMKAVALRGLLAEAKARGYDKDRTFWAQKEDAIFQALIIQDPSDEAANRHMGYRALQDYPAFDVLWEKMNEYYKVLPDEYRAFLTKYEEKLGGDAELWLEPEDYGEASAVLKAFGPWVEKLEADPAVEQIQKGLAQASQTIKNAAAVPVVERPFIVFVASKALNEDGADAKREELTKRGRRIQQGIKVLLATFNERFAVPLKLGDVPTRKVLYHWVYEDRSAFDEGTQMRDGFDVVGEIYAYFSPKSRWAYAYWATEGDEARYVVNDICHEALHQLHWYHSKDPDDKWENYFDRWQALWFNEGWAEYLGGGLRQDPNTGRTTWSGLAMRRVNHLQLLSDTQMTRIPLRELVQQDSFENLMRWIREVWTGILRQDEEIPDTALALMDDPGQRSLHVKTFYAQSWFLAYFLNEYEDGKYRQKYLDLVLTALRGKMKPAAYRTDQAVKERWSTSFDAFVDIMGLKDAEAWKKLQRQHDGFLKKILREARGQ